MARRRATRRSSTCSAPAGAAIPVLEALDQRRLLERVLPEWSRGPRPSRSATPLHRFTVDRHLTRRRPTPPRCGTRCARPDLLLVGTWLHDIGKGFPGDHTEAGIELLDRIGPRMGLAAGRRRRARATSCRHHLLLPDVATRRDLSDDDVIQPASPRQVGSLETLELLAALTEADSLATGPAAWSAWKAELVAQLVDRVAARAAGRRRRRRSPEAASPSPRCSTSMAARLDGRAARRRRCCSSSPPDRPGLFSRVAGTLALQGSDGPRRRRRTATRAWPRRASGVELAAASTSTGTRSSATSRRAIDGRLAIEARLAARASTSRRRPRGGGARGRADVVRFDNARVVDVDRRRGALRGPARRALPRDPRVRRPRPRHPRSPRSPRWAHEVVDAFYVRTAGGTQAHRPRAPPRGRASGPPPAVARVTRRVGAVVRSGAERATHHPRGPGAVERGAGRHRPHRARLHREPLRAGAVRGDPRGRGRHRASPPAAQLRRRGASSRSG